MIHVAVNVSGHIVKITLDQFNEPTKGQLKSIAGYVKKIEATPLKKTVKVPYYIRKES